MNAALLDSIGAADLPDVLAAIHCRQKLNELAAANPPCCPRQALVAEVPEPGTRHYKKAVCGSCGKFFGWIGKPKNLARRAPSTTGLRADSRCAICLTDRALEVHHVVEIADGGDNAPENRMTLCQGCHALVHWVRRYRAAP